jgi:autotransporter-associated beta strand protein
MVNNVLTQKRQHISKESQLGLTNGGFGTLNSAPAPLDTDRDGMPDFYETALGWNPAVQDHNTALPNSGGVITGTSFMPAGTVAGYTRLEEYLHFLAIPHGTVAKNIAGSPSSIEVDLRKFTMGFVKSPVFTTSNLLNGTVTQSGTGGYLVTFIPTVNYVGRAKFDFTVTDSDGSAWTQTCALLVAASGVPRDLRWKGGAAANAWDDTNTNWLRNGAPISFSFGDRVSFDDTGSLTPAVAVTGTVNPSAVDVSAAGNYTLGGTGAITSTGPLNKRGAGTLTIANTGANTFTATTLEEGAITLANATANSSGLGSGALTLNDGTLNMYDAGAGGGFTGTLPTPLIINGDVALNAPSRGGTSGALSGAGTLNLYIPYVRMDWGGDPALFTGTLNVITPAGGGEFRINNGGTGAVTDYGNARVRLSDRTTAYFLPNPPSGGDKTQTVQVGELSTSGTGIGVSLGGASGAGDRFVHWKVGALNTDATFGGAIVNRTGPAMLTKVGAGTLTLTGASTHTGATTVSAGTLRVNGSLGNTPVTVASGATLAGSGQIGGTITAPSGAIVAPGGSDGSAGTLTAAGGFSATSATFNLDLSNSPAGANDKIYVTGGSSFVGGNNTFVVNFKDGVLGAGVYKLIECAPGVAANAQSGVGLTLVTSAPTGTRQTFTMGRDASGTLGGNVRLTVVGSTANLTWVGALNAATWDLNTTANFTGAMPGTFYNLDSITFDDTSANRTVTLAGSLAPNIATVNTTLGYTLGGAGTLDGPAALVKNGTGPLTFAGSAVNTFTGGLTLNGGNIVLTNDTANAGALGTGPVTMNAGTISMFSNMATYNSFTANLVVPAGATARLNADARVDMYGTLTGAGTLNFYIPSIRTDLFTDWSGFTGTLNVLTSGSTGHLRMAKGYNFAGFPAAAVNLGPNCGAYYTGTLSGGEGTTVSFGQLSGAATSFLNGGATGGRAITYRIGGLGTDAIFAGVIAEQNDGTTTSYIKTGAGIWTLTGSGTWNGGTTVEQGTLKISGNFACGSASNVLFGAAIQFLGGSLATDALNIAEGATCTGHGTITGDLNNDGTLTVGTGGTLTVNGEVVNNGVMRFTGGSALVASGGFINNGTLDLLTAGGGLPPNLENNGLVVDSSSLRMVAAAKSGNTVTLSVMTYAGHVYQMQRADSLLAPNWGNVGPARAGNDAVQAFIDAAATGSGGFYRVAVTP